MDCSTAGSPVLHCLLEFAQFMSTESVILSNHLILCFQPLPSIFPSIRVFASDEQSIGVSVSASVLSVNIHSELISFRIDWFDLLEVQRTLKNHLQHHNLKASILQSSTFFMVRLSHPYVTTGKTIALTIRTFVSKVSLD